MHHVKNLLIVLLVFFAGRISAQTSPVAGKGSSKFDQFNKKAEALFKILPVPLYSYSSEAGNIFGLAKFNLIDLSKKDTISKPSKLSEVVTFSTKGRINISVSTELVFHENRYIVISYFNYKKQPEYIFGIGNDVTKAGAELVQYERVKFVATNLVRVMKNFYVGIPLNVSDYFNIRPDSNSFLKRDTVTGLNGGFCVGAGFAAAFDSRDNRYNPYQGAYVIAVYLFHPHFVSAYQFSKFELDARKYFNPWLKHVIAIQATTSYTGGDVPFYELSMLGGDNKMRGYYLGAFRDKVLVDAQVEYRMPVWNIFGITTWIGTGRVADRYADLSLDGFKISYGGGIRVRVDSKHNTNLRFDMGFGSGGISGFYINFAEAF
jgi:outer membrane protein assembly factor BamA